jgi:hypothetical protein
LLFSITPQPFGGSLSQTGADYKRGLAAWDFRPMSLVPKGFIFFQA